MISKYTVPGIGKTCAECHSQRHPAMAGEHDGELAAYISRLGVQ